MRVFNSFSAKNELFRHGNLTISWTWTYPRTWNHCDPWNIMFSQVLKKYESIPSLVSRWKYNFLIVKLLILLVVCQELFGSLKNKILYTYVFGKLPSCRSRNHIPPKKSASICFLWKCICECPSNNHRNNPNKLFEVSICILRLLSSWIHQFLWTEKRMDKVH